MGISSFFCGSNVVLFCFNLVASVSSIREGYIISNNFVRLHPKIALDTNFLVYLLNQDSDIKRQFTMSLQGSTAFCWRFHRQCSKTARTRQHHYHTKNLFAHYSRVGK